MIQMCDVLDTCYSFFSGEGFRYFLLKYDIILALIAVLVIGVATGWYLRILSKGWWNK